jgi:AcrR family transcriptional regulator
MDSIIDLFRSGNLEPTVEEIAERAEVSVRSVHHHFSGVDYLVRRATEVYSERHRSLISALPPHGPLEVRLRAICHQRRLLFDEVGPVLLANYLRANGAPDDGNVVTEYRSLLLRQLATTLRPELLARGSHAQLLLDSLEVATSWLTWVSLRTQGGRSATSAEGVMVFTVTLLLR